MTKLTATLAAVLVLAACAEQVDPAQQYRDALPQKEAIQIGTPSADANPGALSVSRDALGQSPSYGSEYAIMSYWTAVSVNVGVWSTLTLVQIITAYPPSSCDDAACTWGPWPGDDGLNEWKFHAEKVGESYDYALSARPIAGAAEWVDLLVGSATPGADRHHGDGNFTIDFDAQGALDHGGVVDWQQDYGRLEVTYDNRTDLSIGASLVGGKNDDPANPHLMNAVYAFLDTGAGGELQLGVVNLGTAERVSLRTRWDAGGAGRGDAHYNGLDPAGAPVDYFASECWVGAAGDPPWVPAWGEIYDTKVPFGDEADCAFTPASFLDLPAAPIQ